jgi:hypothetical protein
MGMPVIVYGRSGTGKSRSLKEFGEEEITLINVESKPLPFRKRFKYTVCTDNYQLIFKSLARTPSGSIVIDDAGYLLTNAFMRGHSQQRGGSSTYDLFNDIADGFWQLIKRIKMLPDDKIVYLILHEEEADSGITKLKMMGKLLEQKVCVEGMVTIVLRAMCDDTRYYFRTRNSGADITKSPEDMFESDEIENNLKKVDEAIRKYYEI